MYDLYFLRRYIEEMVLAQTAGDEHERAVHLRACRYYGDILHMNDDQPPEGNEVSGTSRKSASGRL